MCLQTLESTDPKYEIADNASYLADTALGAN